MQRTLRRLSEQKTKRTEITGEQIAEQYTYMARVRDFNQTSVHQCYVETYGCQQNEADSETIRGMAVEMGYGICSAPEDADLIVFNTCAIREHAEQRVFGNIGALLKYKRRKPGLVIALCGCMAGEAHVRERIEKSFPYVSLVFSTHDLWRFPSLLFNVLVNGKRIITAEPTDGAIAEGLPVQRDRSVRGWLPIMYGCDNFCSYCIVPYVRGRERSRRPEEILRDAERLIHDDGCLDLTLLGQNVNSYRGGGAEFAELLYRIDQLGLPRIRFMTSHPKDISDELIAAYGELKHLMPALHLPVQSGNDEILRRMNRVYDRAHYLETVEKLRKVCPEIGLTSDIIVGFPGETEAQFEDTLSLVRQVRYDAAYTFIYSPRVGTRAASMPDDTPAEEKSRRITRLIEVVQGICSETLQAQVGKRETVLVESVSLRDAGSVGGKTPRGHMVNFPGNADLIGKFVDVEITSAGRNTLKGRMI